MTAVYPNELSPPRNPHRGRSLNEVQALWSAETPAARLAFVRRLRPALAQNSLELAELVVAATSSQPSSLAEKLAAEILPLADACRWLERRASFVLRTRRWNRKLRPLWLGGSSFEVQRQSYGSILIIGPANYPLFLPAVQSLHALVAGNAVLLKPAPGTRAVALAFQRLVLRAGLDQRLFTVLPEENSAVTEAIVAGVDKVVFTGSSENGHEVLSRLNDGPIPALMELSGHDPMIVMADADIDLAVAALRFGTRWNSGNTCIAPRQILAQTSVALVLRARLVSEGIGHFPMATFQDPGDAADLVTRGRYGLGATIFSANVAEAKRLAGRLATGFVLINDMIVPTADPRFPFGGQRASGFGVTRGEEGLLEMTRPHVVALRRGRRRRHFDPVTTADADFFSSYIAAAHSSGFRARFRGLRGLVRALLQRRQKA